VTLTVAIKFSRASASGTDSRLAFSANVGRRSGGVNPRGAAGYGISLNFRLAPTSEVHETAIRLFLTASVRASLNKTLLLKYTMSEYRVSSFVPTNYRKAELFFLLQGVSLTIGDPVATVRRSRPPLSNERSFRSVSLCQSGLPSFRVGATCG